MALSYMNFPVFHFNCFFIEQLFIKKAEISLFPLLSLGGCAPRETFPSGGKR